MKILVIGATGSIGSLVVEKGISEGIDTGSISIIIEL